MTIEILKIRKRLEEISEEHRNNCQRHAIPETVANEINHHNIYCDALDAAYQTFCKENNFLYEPLKREQVK